MDSSDWSSGTTHYAKSLRGLMHFVIVLAMSCDATFRNSNTRGLSACRWRGGKRKRAWQTLLATSCDAF
jgi:hypothetical protein